MEKTSKLNQNPCVSPDRSPSKGGHYNHAHVLSSTPWPSFLYV